MYIIVDTIHTEKGKKPTIGNAGPCNTMINELARVLTKR